MKRRRSTTWPRLWRTDHWPPDKSKLGNAALKAPDGSATARFLGAFAANEMPSVRAGQPLRTSATAAASAGDLGRAQWGISGLDGFFHDDWVGSVGSGSGADSSAEWERARSEIQAAKARRVAQTGESAELVAEVTQILFDADPIGINFETNTDEYTSEAETIVINLPRAPGVVEVQALVYDTFRAWFGPTSAGSPDSVRRACCGNLACLEQAPIAR